MKASRYADSAVAFSGLVFFPRKSVPLWRIKLLGACWLASDGGTERVCCRVSKARSLEVGRPRLAP